MKRESKETGRRKVLKALGVGGLSIAGPVGLSQAVSTAQAAPVWQDSSEDAFTTPGPEKAYLGRHTYVSHTSTVQYYGVAERSNPSTGEFYYGHVYRVAGRGQSGIYNTEDGETKEDAGDYPRLTGHAINIKNFNKGVWTPSKKEAQNNGKLGAHPAENNTPMDSTERAENIFSVLLGAVPAIGSVVDAYTIAHNLSVDKSSSNRTLEWSLDSIAGINYETTSVTNHHLEFEIRAKPGNDINGDVVSITTLGDKLEAKSPKGTLWNLSASTPDQKVSSLAEAESQGLDVEKVDTESTIGTQETDFLIKPESYNHTTEEL